MRHLVVADPHSEDAEMLGTSIWIRRGEMLDPPMRRSRDSRFWKMTPGVRSPHRPPLLRGYDGLAPPITNGFTVPPFRPEPSVAAGQDLARLKVNDGVSPNSLR